MIKSIKYLIIIGRAKVRDSKPGKGFEKHHITPRCCGGKDERSNLVVLTYQEHYEAHKELAARNPNIEGLQWAWLLMCQRDCNKTAEEFAEARRRVSEIMSDGRNKGENNNFYGVDHSGENNGFYGKHHTEESRQSMSKTKKKMVKEDPKFRQALADKAKLGGAARSLQIARSVECIETGEIFRTINEAQKKYGVHVGDVCRGTRNTCAGLHFQFIK